MSERPTYKVSFIIEEIVETETQELAKNKAITNLQYYIDKGNYVEDIAEVIKVERISDE